MGKSAQLKRIDGDLKFLQLLQQSTDVLLLKRMLKNHVKGAEWKREAISRRIRKLEKSLEGD
jgi:hypothetical protein